MAKKNYYDILCVGPGCSQDEVRRAYRERVRASHPDLHPDDHEATRRVQEINEAYETLSDPARQAAYDRELADAERVRQAAARRPTARSTYASDRVRPQPVEARPMVWDDEDDYYLQYLPRRRQSLLDDLLGGFEDGLDDELIRIRRLIRRLIR